ncbi:MAG: MarR family transcriptional regulator [Candidatus Limiplasma sp.]|nr:MarR family transcriptional regulator [Candidatus Limiplasma sp.]
MDITQRRISIIARGVNSFATRTMRREGIGASEFDLIHVVRCHPGITQAEVCQRLEIDKGAAARQFARLEAKGYLRRETNPADKRSRLLYATEKADELKNSRAHLEELFYEWLVEPLSVHEKEELARLLAALEPRCREEWRAGFPSVRGRLAAEKAQKLGGGPA